MYCPRDEERIEEEGVVIGGGAIQGATVCADLNSNGACDPNEPVSGPTDAEGRFSIRSTISGGANESALSATGAANAAGANDTIGALEKPNNFVGPGPSVPVKRPMIAMVSASAVDASRPALPVGTAYVLRAPEFYGGVISPITTLVQAGIAQGMTLAQAEAAVAAQLQVSAFALYRNYTQAAPVGPGWDPTLQASLTALATYAPSIVATLQAGAPLLVSAPAATVVDYHVRAFTLGSAGAYILRLYYVPTALAGNGLYTFYDVRSSVVGGSPVAASTLYDSALLSTAQGWAPNTGATAHTVTGGSPSVLTYSGGYKYVATGTVTDVAGQAVADVVRRAQDLSVNTFSTLVGVNPATLTGTMPAGAKLQKITTVGTEAPVAYRVSDGSVSTALPTLPAVVTAYPVPSAPTPANTLSMGTLRGSAGCATTVCPQEFLRVAFAPGNAAAYYLCDVERATDVQSNCVAAGNGSYALAKAADGSTPIMTFAGLPAAASVQTFTRVFVERGGRVNVGFQDKTVTSTSTRLNKAAFEALAPALGIAPPTINPTASPYVGAWTAAYTGGDAGSCPVGGIDALGYLTGSCSSTVTGQSFTVSGSISPAGAADFTSFGGSSSGARFTGTLSGASGSGTWLLSSPPAAGTWTANKVP